MIKLTIDTRAVTTSRDVDHGLSLISDYPTTSLIILGDSLIEDDWSATQVIDTGAVADVRVAVDAKLTVVDRLRALCHAAVGIAARVVRTARVATAWATTAAAGVAGLLGDWWRRYRGPAGRHRVATTWYGRARSTSEFVAQLRVARGREPSGDSPEGDLPGSTLPSLPGGDAFVGWIERYIEVMREEQLVLHLPGRHFTCS